MTTADLKRAFMDERPVRYNGITYQRVTAVIYRKTRTKPGCWYKVNCWTRTDVPL